MGVMFLQGRRLVAVAGLAAAVAAYVLNNKLNAGYSYLRWCSTSTLIGLDPYPAKLVVSTNPADYLAAYGRMLKTLTRSPHVVIYFVAACLAIIHRKALFRIVEACWRARRRSGRAVPRSPAGAGGLRGGAPRAVADLYRALSSPIRRR